MSLLEFPHSHYCEKARWALDFKGIPYQPIAILPGFHIHTVRKYAPDTSVPVLITSKEAIQGSGDIIDYLERIQPSPSLTPTDPDEARASQEIETTMEDRLGENIRRILYSTLLAYPGFIRYCFTHPLPRIKPLTFSLIYPLLRKIIHQVYVVSPAMVERSKREFAIAMQEIDNLLGQNQYLVDNQFSRADLCTASMLSLLAMPEEHPFPWIDIPDAQTENFFAEYQHHPVIEYVARMYRDHRL